ncbi:DUF547 domain-containing protein [Natronorubrum thiooxidans]|uniref:DUF547 domain-containing protein n=1 Tax=Natronorubrum thiooxidans TaxID=308853 RepID=A0A1N7GML4_9EURY|nr:DUF547 domain-containing protein [Natronorubrum thiooxidans]SIS13800.1 Protein of unknown function, DUF547 [Natronorubrum thiooxidans]
MVNPPDGDSETASAAAPVDGSTPTHLSLTTAASRLLESVKYETPPKPFLNRLAGATDDDLTTVRTDRQAGLAFWLNVYNAATQLLLERRPERFESRLRFFRAHAVTVGGTHLSLDDIEHGVLRGGKSKYGLGYLPRLESTGLGRSYRLEVDPRIHFALNCGAASCPAILTYDPDTIDETLDYATQSYLDETVTYDADRNRVRVPRLCLWFISDFGGRSGVRQLLREFEQIPPESSPSLRFHGYDWTKAGRKFGKTDRTE